MARVFRNDLFGEWPSAVGMWVIRAPHNVAVAEELGQVKSDQIRLKSRPNLALEDFARHRLERDVLRFLPLELSAVTIVHLLNDKGNPTDSGLGKAEP